LQSGLKLTGDGGAAAGVRCSADAASEYRLTAISPPNLGIEADEACGLTVRGRGCEKRLK